VNHEGVLDRILDSHRELRGTFPSTLVAAELAPIALNVADVIGEFERLYNITGLEHRYYDTIVLRTLSRLVLAVGNL
jgi:hypothetical protein